jgi:hypothetical protein
MESCCPPGEGCNSPSGLEPCSLSRLRDARSDEADRALSLWARYVGERGVLGGRRRRRRRVLRRAYERVRDRALPAWTPFRNTR